MSRWCLAVALGFAASACLAQSVTLDKIRKSGTITLGYVEGAVPFSFVHEGEPQGYSVELCRRIAGDLRRQLKLTKLDTKWVALTVQNRLEAVRKGQVDLECSTTSRTLSRGELVDFSLLTFVDGASVLVRREGPLRRLSDFAGKRLAVISGTTAERGIGEAIEKMRIDAQLVPVKGRAEGLALLDANRVDGVVSDRLALYGAAITSPNATTYHLFNEIYTVEPYALALRRGDTDFRLAVDRALAGLYRDGGIGEIYDKWFKQLGDPPTILGALYLLQGLQE